MKLAASTLSAALAVTVTTSPIGLDITKGLVLQSRATGTTANDYLNGGCKDVILFFARGTDQPGNMGVDYDAALLANILPGGCNPVEARDFATLLSGAAQKCPSSKLVVSGYSQGAALVHAAVEQLDSSARARIFAAVTYGDTQKKQDGGKIPNFDASKTLILCNDGDLVCEGVLIITSAHLDYTSSVPTGVSFFVSKLG
ncbi:carbohydrate esterase family 5 protein [Xylaria sp. FL1042]|nr:carbohydrate esterase family 5 protein [Xylaria sp. FL1042]